MTTTTTTVILAARCLQHSWDANTPCEPPGRISRLHGSKPPQADAPVIPRTPAPVTTRRGAAVRAPPLLGGRPRASPPSRRRRILLEPLRAPHSMAELSSCRTVLLVAVVTCAPAPSFRGRRRGELVGAAAVLAVAAHEQQRLGHTRRRLRRSTGLVDAAACRSSHRRVELAVGRRTRAATSHHPDAVRFAHQKRMCSRAFRTAP